MNSSCCFCLSALCRLRTFPSTHTYGHFLHDSVSPDPRPRSKRLRSWFPKQRRNVRPPRKLKPAQSFTAQKSARQYPPMRYVPALVSRSIRSAAHTYLSAVITICNPTIGVYSVATVALSRCTAVNMTSSLASRASDSVLIGACSPVVLCYLKAHYLLCRALPALLL